jgi:hypothetical protein
MPDTQIFGKLCPTCHKFAAFGKVDIPNNTPPSKLHAKLQETGWQSDSVRCETPKCETKIFGERDEMILKASRPKV